jgi:hypothetical protein
MLRCFAICNEANESVLRLWRSADSRSSAILTYDPVRCGCFLPAAVHSELFEQPAGVDAASDAR